MGGSQELGVDSRMGGWEILKSLYIVGRGALTPLIYEDPLPPILPIPPPFLELCPTRASHFPVTSSP